MINSPAGEWALWFLHAPTTFPDLIGRRILLIKFVHVLSRVVYESVSYKLLLFFNITLSMDISVSWLLTTVRKLSIQRLTLRWTMKMVCQSYTTCKRSSQVPIVTKNTWTIYAIWFFHMLSQVSDHYVTSLRWMGQLHWASQLWSERGFWYGRKHFAASPLGLIKRADSLQNKYLICHFLIKFSTHFLLIIYLSSAMADVFCY